MAESTQNTQEILQRWNTIAELESNGSGELAESFAPDSGQDVLFAELHLAFATKPTTIGSPITLTFDSKSGDAYDVELDSTDPATAGAGETGITSYTFGYELGKLLRDNDALKIDYANPDGVAWNLTVLGRKK